MSDTETDEMAAHHAEPVPVLQRELGMEVARRPVDRMGVL